MRIVDQITNAAVTVLIVVIPALLIWLVSSQSFTSAIIIGYGLCVVFAMLCALVFVIRRKRELRSAKETMELLDIVKLHSTVVGRISALLRVFAQLLVWPTLFNFNPRWWNYAAVRDNFGMVIPQLAFPSDVAVSLLTAMVAVALSLWSSPEMPLVHQILFAACLVHVTARHLSYLLVPGSLRESFQSTPGDVFFRLFAVAFLDLITLACVYTTWANEIRSPLSLHTFLATILGFLSFKAPMEILAGSSSSVWQRIQTANLLLYYSAIVRVLWPLKELERQDRHLVFIAIWFALKGWYSEALRWLHGVKDPRNLANKIFGLCYLGRGDFTKALAYVQRDATGSERKSYAFFVLFSMVPFVVPDYSELAEWPSEVRGKLRDIVQKTIHRQLLTYAAEAEITDSVFWLGFISYSLREALPLTKRDTDIKQLLETNHFPLTRCYAEFEVAEFKWTFFQRIMEEVSELGDPPELITVEDNIARLRNEILNEAPKHLADRALQLGTLTAVSSLTKEPPSPEWQAEFHTKVEEIRRLIRDTEDDTERAITSQVLANLTFILPTNADPNNSFYRLTEEAVTFLEVEWAWVIEKILPAMSKLRRREW